MTDQHALDFNPMARRTDPTSSHAAADRLERSGRLKESQREVLDWLRLYPARTSRTMAKLIAGGDEVKFLTVYDRLKKRLPDLRNKGFAWATDKGDGTPLVWCPRVSVPDGARCETCRLVHRR